MQHRQHVFHRFKPRQPGSCGFGKDDMARGWRKLLKDFDGCNVSIENGGFAKRARHREHIKRQFRPAHIHQNGVERRDVLRRARPLLLVQPVIVERHDQPLSPVIDDNR